jgi:hypothetical protein
VVVEMLALAVEVPEVSIPVVVVVRVDITPLQVVQAVPA